jgi:hypothetical protein
MRRCQMSGIADDLTSQNPLLKFSLYTHGQSVALQEVGSDILRLLAEMKVGEGAVDAETARRAYNLFWLWTLGAYEVVRTMSDPKRLGCFSEEASKQLLELKKRLARCGYRSRNKSYGVTAGLFTVKCRSWM